MEKKRLTDVDVTNWAQRMLIPLVNEVHLIDRQKVIGRMLELEMAHIDYRLAMMRAAKKED